MAWSGRVATPMTINGAMENGYVWSRTLSRKGYKIALYGVDLTGG